MRLVKRPVGGPFVLQLLLLSWLFVATGSAQTINVLHEFSNGLDGASPFGGLISDGHGNYFGVTSGGYQTFGTVFELSPASGGGWNLTTLYTFQGGQDGYTPIATLAMDKAGNLYGATSIGGNGTSSYCDNGTGPKGCGTIFELSPSGGGGWQKTILYQFQGVIGKLHDGIYPSGPLVLDSAGNLYGTTEFGGDGGGCLLQGCGTVFELSPSAGGWNETILVSISYGLAPLAGMIFDSAGNLYGTTSGGTNPVFCYVGCGTAFKLSPKAGGGWEVTPLYTFPPVYAGPWTPLVLDSSGALYGSSDGGNFKGVIYKLNPSSSASRFTLVRKFNGTEGSRPGQLVFDTNGNIYGTTVYGGSDQLCCGAIQGCGEVFKLSPTSSGAWQETILYRFQGKTDGSLPGSPVIFDNSGNIYGVATEGGTFGYGTVFEITAH